MRGMLVVGLVLVWALAAPIAEAKRPDKEERGRAEKEERVHPHAVASPEEPSPVPSVLETPAPAAPATEGTKPAPLANADGPDARVPPVVPSTGQRNQRGLVVPHPSPGAPSSMSLAPAPFWLEHVPLLAMAMAGLVVARPRRFGPRDGFEAKGDAVGLGEARVRAAPFDADARLDLGLVLMRGGRMPEALPQLARAFTLDPATIVRFLEDPDLVSLRETQEVRELLSMLERMHAQRVDPAYA